MTRPPIVDSHLDMAMNVVYGRDYNLTVAELRAKEQRPDHELMVTLPDLRRGGVAVACATIFVGTETYDGDQPVYDPPASVKGRRQLDVYREWEHDGQARIIRHQQDLRAHLSRWAEDGVLGLVLLMESADPIETPDDLPWWWDAGVRMIGPAWRRTRYAGGTGMPGGLTAMGRDLLTGMRELGVILDLSHLAEQSFWEALEVGAHQAVATHANVRALVPTDRQLSDEMIAAVGTADGVIGVVPGNEFLDARWEHGTGPPLGLEAVRQHLEHIAGLIGWLRVGIGSDFDGGFCRENTPVEIETVADLHRIGDVVPAVAREGVLGGNWLRLLGRALPPATVPAAPASPATAVR